MAEKASAPVGAKGSSVAQLGEAGKVTDVRVNDMAGERWRRRTLIACHALQGILANRMVEPEEASRFALRATLALEALLDKES